MFKNWQKRKRSKRMYNDILKLSLDETNKYESLLQFHRDLLDFIYKYKDLLENTKNYLSDKERIQINKKLIELTKTYTANIISVNDNIIVCLENNQFSNKLKSDILTFGADSTHIATLTLELLEHMAKTLG